MIEFYELKKSKLNNRILGLYVRIINKVNVKWSTTIFTNSKFI